MLRTQLVPASMKMVSIIFLGVLLYLESRSHLSIWDQLVKPTGTTATAVRLNELDSGTFLLKFGLLVFDGSTTTTAAVTTSTSTTTTASPVSCPATGAVGKSKS